MSRFPVLAVTVAAALVTGCSPSTPLPNPVQVAPTVLDAVVADPAARSKAPVTELATLVPADADAFGTMDFASFGAGFEAMMGGSAAASALKKDLEAVFGRLLGPDLSAARQVVAWVNIEQKAAGVVLHGEFGRARLKSGKLESVAGVKALPLEDAWLATLGKHVVIANEAGLKGMVAVHKRKAKALLGSPRWAVVDRGLSLVRGEAPLFVAVAGRRLLAEVLEKTPMKGADFSQLAFGFGRDLSLTAAAQGSKAARMQLEGLVEMGRKMARNEAQSQRQKALVSDDLLEAAVGVTAAHATLAGVEMLKLETVGDALVGRVRPASEHATYMAVTGILAAVAIPAFIKYRRRALTTEAIDEIDRLYKGAALYYTTPRVNRRGEKLPCQFPASQGPTPVETTCCQAQGGPDRDGDDRCDVNPGLWAGATWSALNFQMNNQHHFVYSFDSSGTGPDAGFTITANADLDCDGVMSTFQRMGFADPAQTGAECSVRGSSSFYVEKETE